MAEAVGSSRERGQGKKGRDACMVPTWGVMLAGRGGLREAAPVVTLGGCSQGRPCPSGGEHREAQLCQAPGSPFRAQWT